MSEPAEAATGANTDNPNQEEANPESPNQEEANPESGNSGQGVANANSLQ